MSGSVDAVVQNEGLTLEEQAANFHTAQHIQLVTKLLHRMASELLVRSERHDQSKLVSPEVEYMARYTPRLNGLTFGSPEYEANKKLMEPALLHHYANNRHHPEHFKNGVNDMNLIDVLEMLLDWRASSTRHANGNIRKSIEINANKYGISPQLVRILENTLELLEF